MTNPFRSPCCAGYERRFSAKKPSVLHADGLNKVSQMHLPPPGLPRFGGGERPPFLCKPPTPLTITMSLRLVLSTSPISLRALNFPFSIASPSGPLSRIGKGGGGKGQIRLWLPWERICAQYGLISAPAVNQSVSSTASDRGLGAAPQAYFAYFCTHKSRPPPGRRADYDI